MDENKKNKNSIFSLIISILSLVFMTLGTTFAFFTSFIKSDNDAVEVKSANYKLSADITPLYNSKKIIPTNDTDIMKAFKQKCIDSKEFGACYAYNIKITTEGDPQDVIGYLSFNAEELPNLKYMILDSDNLDENNDYLVYKEESYANSENKEIGDVIHLENGKTRNLILIVWLSNLNVPQNEEIAKSFTGHFTVNSTLGTKITGSLTASVNNS